MFLKSAGKNGTKETKNDMKRAKFIINEAASDKEILNYTESVIGCLMMNQIVNHVDVIYTNKAEDALKFALENEQVKNIAITGQYSSGKSSIIQSYFSKYVDKKDYLNMKDYCDNLICENMDEYL